MGKILIVYHSQQYGDTKILAEAFMEGAKDGGAQIEMFNTNEHRITFQEFMDADGVAIGTPDYYSYVAGTIKTFFDDIWLWDRAGEQVKGKPAALFFTHGKGGRGREPFETFARRYFELVGETVDSFRPTTEEILHACRNLGKTLAEKVR
ncbi:MAG: flavodoxin family protein [Deltaproteobacteria bacterium]|nr:flavodoxin family protein [Deltaproteobacteria bacterium]